MDDLVEPVARALFLKRYGSDKFTPDSLVKVDGREVPAWEFMCGDDARVCLDAIRLAEPRRA